jgi:hypothetical protein
MSIDSKKLKKMLEKYDIHIIEYYSLDGDCAIIKCFLTQVTEFLLIYIPTKLRFPISSGKNVYALENIEEHTDNDDYSKSSKIPDMESIDEEKSVSTYNDLTKKYNKTISLEGNDEPIQRKLKRQIDRLRIPFQKIYYDIGIQNGKYLTVAFGDNISMFSIKGYSDKNRYILFIITIRDFIDKLDDIKDEISTIKKQFYEILIKVSLSNLEQISSSIENYSTITNNISQKKEQYRQSIQEFQQLYQSLKEKEENVIYKFKESITKLQGVKRDSLENELQKQLNNIFSSKMDLVSKGILLASGYQRNLLILEEISFDNSIMIDRVQKNFTILKEIY